MTNKAPVVPRRFTAGYVMMPSVETLTQHCGELVDHMSSAVISEKHKKREQLSWLESAPLYDRKEC